MFKGFRTYSYKEKLQRLFFIFSSKIKMSIEMITKVYYLRDIDLVDNILVNLGAKVKQVI